MNREQRTGTGDAERAVDRIDRRDAGSDGETGRPSTTKRGANEKERHRPDPDGNEEPEPEADDERVHEPSLRRGSPRPATKSARCPPPRAAFRDCPDSFQMRCGS